MSDKVFQTVIVGHQFDAVFSLREQFAREPIADIRNLVF